MEHNGKREMLCVILLMVAQLFSIPQRFTELDSLVRTNKVIFVIVKTFSCRQEVSKCRVRGESKESTIHRRGSIQMSDPLSFETQSKRHQKFKTEVSVTPQKGLMSSTN